MMQIEECKMLDQAVFNENFNRIFLQDEPKEEELTKADKRRKHEEFEEDKRNADLNGMTLKEYRESM